MKIALGADHSGFVLKDTIKKYLADSKIEFTDYGTFKIEVCNYPEFGYKVGQAVASGSFDLGVLFGDTGMGMCIIANKIKGIRATLALNEETARLSRLHYNANILCLGSTPLSEKEALEITKTWLQTSFEGGIHDNRLNLITQLTGI